jgi:hypothetical protein
VSLTKTKKYDVEDDRFTPEKQKLRSVSDELFTSFHECVFVEVALETTEPGFSELTV